MKNARRAAAAGHKTFQRRRRPPVRRRTALISTRDFSTPAGVLSHLGQRHFIIL